MDRNDPRCASRFALNAIESMFQYCCGGYHGCPVFHRINMESANESPQGFRSPAREFVTPSVRGAPLRRTAIV